MRPRSARKPRFRATRGRGAGPRSLAADVRWGAAWGVWYAAFFDVLLLLAAWQDPAGLARRCAAPVPFLLFFTLGLPALGALVGVCRPALRSRLGAVAVATLVCALFLAVQFRLQGGPLDGVPWLAIVFGAIFGLSVHRRTYGRGRSGPNAA